MKLNLISMMKWRMKMIRVTKKCRMKKQWINIEMEHASLFPKSKQKIMARKIANQHIAEMGCGYYPALIKMERKLSRLRLLKGGKRK